MKCFKCGAELEADARFCTRCGSPQGFSRELIDAAARGEQGAITELYNRTYNNVYQSVRMMIKDEDTVLDIVQDAYIQGFKYLNQLSDPNHYRAWMKRIGINTAKNYLKKKSRCFFQRWKAQEKKTVRNFSLLMKGRRIFRRWLWTDKRPPG